MGSNPIMTFNRGLKCGTVSIKNYIFDQVNLDNREYNFNDEILFYLQPGNLNEIASQRQGKRFVRIR